MTAPEYPDPDPQAGEYDPTVEVQDNGEDPDADT